MSDDADIPAPGGPESASERERVVAAEFALGLLEGEELLAARGRLATDPDFAARREWWDEWFAPLSDEVSGAQPGAHVWDGIAARVNGAQVSREAASVSATPLEGPSNVTSLDMERRVRRWQWTAGLSSAAAAVALALFFSAPGAAPQADEAPLIAAGAPLMASIPIGDTPLRLGVTFIPASDEMLVSASGLTADGVHDHELWLVPEDGSAPQSLGVVVPGEERRMLLPENIVQNMGPGVGLVLTREPIGGKPEGVDAGPVVAQGQLDAV
ncbi:MAG: anti-sigma factor [Erythrobacter sp.]|uniref:anti-sigma factor n=1 Tax=Erythrobacter sp. TaxID=1042 RepID=UPI00260CE734|nr:anti-sigma factor [Erythrobacter sp.]MDJ0978897.1 anti-sigma factor [Erythrobacter sp.]